MGCDLGEFGDTLNATADRLFAAAKSIDHFRLWLAWGILSFYDVDIMIEEGRSLVLRTTSTDRAT